MTKVILVNELDHPLGVLEKMAAHREALLHRAFSVFIFNEAGEMLLQQRAFSKYHSGGLWTNACCSHPLPGEETEHAAKRRLMEEMGIATPLRKIFDFTYRHAFENGLTEYEFDHVFIGTYDGVISPDPAEVDDHCYKSLPQIRRSLEAYPSKYTAWFHIAFPMVESWLNENTSGSKIHLQELS